MGDRNYPGDRDEIERLQHESAVARAQYLSVSSEFDSLAIGIISRTNGMQYSDGMQALDNLVKRHSEALRKYRKAVEAVTSSVLGRPLRGKGLAIASGLNGITPREREVLTLIASGKSSKQIGELLGIAFKTVVCHRYRLQTKLNSHNTADLTRAAIRMSLINV